jgi:hypothetical protein
LWHAFVFAAVVMFFQRVAVLLELIHEISGAGMPDFCGRLILS